MRAGAWRFPSGAVLATLLGLALAGCFGDPSQKRSPDGEIDFDDPRAVRIAGHVLNEDYFGVSDATVTLEPAGRDDTTDAEGRFRFAVLEAGLYTLRAQREGFLPTLAEVDVPAHGVQDLILVLRATPDGAPYRETVTRVSHAVCHSPAGGGCVGNDAVPDSSPDFQYEIPGDGLQEILFEAVWQENAFAGPGSFVARNPDGVFLLSCNLTNPEGVDPLTRV